LENSNLSVEERKQQVAEIKAKLAEVDALTRSNRLQLTEEQRADLAFLATNYQSENVRQSHLQTNAQQENTSRQLQVSSTSDVQVVTGLLSAVGSSKDIKKNAHADADLSPVMKEAVAVRLASQDFKVSSLNEKEITLEDRALTREPAAKEDLTKRITEFADKREITVNYISGSQEIQIRPATSSTHGSAWSPPQN
jgi:hypothetical protein